MLVNLQVFGHLKVQDNEHTTVLFSNEIIYSVFTTIIKDIGLYMLIILPLRKSSFRKMIKEGHNNRQINLTVLENLKPIACGGQSYQHGDLKEKCNFKITNSRTSFDNTI